MLTKEQLNIFSVFWNNIFSGLTFKQIKEQSRQKSNNIVQIALKEFQKLDIIASKSIGDVKVYSLNLNNNFTFAFLNIINEHKISKTRLPKQILDEIQKRIFKHTEFFILIVFGSHAKNSATKSSDLDIAVIAESELTKKDIAPFLETVKRREITAIDYHIFSRVEFLDMLNADFENLGKQIYNNCIVYYGYIPYCEIINERHK